MENYKYVGGTKTSSHFNFVYEGGEKTLKEFHEELVEFSSGDKSAEEHPKFEEFVKFLVSMGINDKGEEVPIATYYDLLTFYMAFGVHLIFDNTKVSKGFGSLAEWSIFLDSNLASLYITKLISTDVPEEISNVFLKDPKISPDFLKRLQELQS